MRKIVSTQQNTTHRMKAKVVNCIVLATDSHPLPQGVYMSLSITILSHY